MIDKILDYLNLKNIGAFELFYASIFIISAYSLNGIPLSAVLWVLFAVLSFFKKKKKIISSYKPLIYLSVYCILHDFIYLFIANGNLNAFILQIVYFWCIYKAPSIMDVKKLKGSINWIALISMVGLIYQWGIISAGGDVYPIQLPFGDIPENRLDRGSIRPSSFFMEPAAFVAFMYVPLAFSLIDRKFIWTAVILAANFLTTSSTGILTSFIMLGVYVFSQKVSTKIRLFVIVLAGIMFFSLTHLEAFDAGVEKIENTDTEKNVRLAQGPYVVSTMESNEYVFGAAYSSAYYYCKSGRAPMVVFYDKEVYMSTIWMIILKYGLAGLMLYLLFYFKIVKKNRETLPLVVCLMAVMFSASYGVGPAFVMTSTPLLLMMNKKNER